MSGTLEVYTFESAPGVVPSDYQTQDINEAREYARLHGFAIIANEYEFVDSEAIEDYRPDEVVS